MSERRLVAPLLALAVLAVPPAAARAAKESGIFWEQTVEMKTQGFAMPGHTSKICAPPRDRWTQPPKAGDDDCVVSDLHRSGTKMTWKVVCEKQGMSGDGEMEWAGEDRYTAKINMRSKDMGAMVMNVRGQKVGGECDPSEGRRRVEAMQKQVGEAQASQAAAMAKRCDEAVASMQWQLFEMDLCKDRKAFCTRLETREGYAAFLAGTPQQQRAAVAQKCGKDLEAIRAKHCAAAAKEARYSGSDYADSAAERSVKYLRDSCPAEVRALAQRECAGRSYTGRTAVTGPLRDLCIRHAQDVLAEGDRKVKQEAQPAKAPAKPEDAAVEQGKKAVKGLFGF